MTVDNHWSQTPGRRHGCRRRGGERPPHDPLLSTHLQTVASPVVHTRAGPFRLPVFPYTRRREGRGRTNGRLRTVTGGPRAGAEPGPVDNLSLSLSLDLSLRVYVQRRARERQRQSGETITHRDPPQGWPGCRLLTGGLALRGRAVGLGERRRGRLSSATRCSRGGFVHVHVHGVYVPYARRREARARTPAPSTSVAQRGPLTTGPPYPNVFTP